MVCYDMDGKLLWKKEVGALDSGWFLDPTYQWGHASSPVIYKSSVIVQADQAKGSFIAAFNLADGRELWRTAADRRGLDVGHADDPQRDRKATSW